MMIKIIAIDPGYDRVGIALLAKENNQKEKVLFSETFISNRNEDIYQRLFAIGDRFSFLVKKYQPDFFVTESLFFSKNTKTALHVAELRGILFYLAKKNNLEIYEFTPNQIKLAITSNGRAEKKDILFMLPYLIKLPERKEKYIDDELDALAIGLTFFASYRKK